MFKPILGKKLESKVVWRFWQKNLKVYEFEHSAKTTSQIVPTLNQLAPHRIPKLTRIWPRISAACKRQVSRIHITKSNS